jgi:exosortase/archaeosortase family protein
VHVPCPHLAFVGRVLVVWIAAWGALSLFPKLEIGTISATVWCLSTLLRLGTREVGVAGASVTALGASIQIVSDCTSLVATILLSGAIVAYPARGRWKLVGLLGGSIALWIYNLIRVIGLMIVLARWPAVFDLVHVYVWQSLTVILVACLFSLWLRFHASESAVPEQLRTRGTR